MAKQPKTGAPGATGPDTDQDGLSDDVERKLGTDVHSRDTDGDGFGDGFEVAWGNPARVKDIRVADPVDAARIEREAVAKIEQRLGVQHNVDTDDDGLADWAEEIRVTDRSVADFDPDTVVNPSPLDKFMEAALSQQGKPYKFGSKSDPYDPEGAATWDSSELVEWAAKQAGLEDLPDGSWLQYRHLVEHGGKVTFKEAMETEGALVFGFSSDPMASTDRPTRAYVGISLGNGKVLDISERTGVVREMDPGKFYTYGAVIPDLHKPTGDLDGDGWTDQEEIDFGGDPSNSLRVPKEQNGDPIPVDVEVPSEVDEDADPVDPRTPATQPPPNDTDLMDPRQQDPERPPNDTDLIDPRQEPSPNDTDLMDPRQEALAAQPTVEPSGYGDTYSDDETASADDLPTDDDTYSDT